MFGTQDLILIGIIVVVLFGATRLPQIGSGIGQAIRNFKKGVSENEEIETSGKDTPEKDSPKKEGTRDTED
jgi:sec-independent protein translocase protein TatA